MAQQVIEIDGYKLDERKLMNLRVPPEKGDGELRLILPSTSWNTSGKFLLHSMITGRVQPVDDIIELLRDRGLLDDVLIKE